MSDEEPITYRKLDDTRLQEDTETAYYSRLIRVFDFDAEQITTCTYTTIQRSQAAAVDSPFVLQQFNEVAARSIEKAHKKLIELGGNPPPLEELELREKKASAGKSDKKPLKLG